MEQVNTTPEPARQWLTDPKKTTKKPRTTHKKCRFFKRNAGQNRLRWERTVCLPGKTQVLYFPNLLGLRDQHSLIVTPDKFYQEKSQIPPVNVNEGNQGKNAHYTFAPDWCKWPVQELNRCSGSGKWAFQLSENWNQSSSLDPKECLHLPTQFGGHASK